MVERRTAGIGSGKRRWRQRRVRRWAAFVVAFAAVAGLVGVAVMRAFAWETVSIVEVSASRDAEVLGVGVGSCNAQTRIDQVVETDREVRIALSARRGDGNDCLDSARIELARPVGERTVIDLVSGQRFNPPGEDGARSWERAPSVGSVTMIGVDQIHITVRGCRSTDFVAGFDLSVRRGWVSFGVDGPESRICEDGVTIDAGSLLWGKTVSGFELPDQPLLTLPQTAGVGARTLAVDPAGTLYMANRTQVFRLEPGGGVTTVAGTGAIGSMGDGGAATEATFTRITSLAADAAGNVYVGDSDAGRIRKVDAAGMISTLVGARGSGFSGDGGPAADARITNPHGMAVDSEGNLYFGDWGNRRLRRISTSGIITTIAGSGSSGVSGDGGPALEADFGFIAGVAVDGLGNIYLADGDNGRIRRIDPNGTITTVAGGSGNESSGVPKPADQVRVGDLTGVAADGPGIVYFSDSSNFQVLKIDASSMISLVAGDGNHSLLANGRPATPAGLGLPISLAAAPSGETIYIATNESDTVLLVELGTFPHIAQPTN